MSVQQETTPPAPSGPQLAQLTAPLHEAREAFSRRDEAGRIPIVMVIRRLPLINVTLLIVALAVVISGIMTRDVVEGGVMLYGSIVIAALIFIAGMFRALFGLVPEGAVGLRAQRGAQSGLIGSGMHFLPPWAPMTHLVNQRDIPFDVPAFRSLTQENVRTDVDALVVFHIVDPLGFVRRTTANDFDQVFQATCQDAMRTAVRTTTVERVVDLDKRDTEALKTLLDDAVVDYGVEVVKVQITYAQPPVEFVNTQESRQLAALQRAEQEQKYALVRQQQTGQEALISQGVQAKVRQQMEELQGQVELAEARKRVVESQADAEVLRLARLEERLLAYPNAAQYDWETSRLEVARALAGNTRAVVQVGNADDIAQALVIRDLMAHGQPRDGSSSTAAEEEEGTDHPQQKAA